MTAGGLLTLRPWTAWGGRAMEPSAPTAVPAARSWDGSLPHTDVYDTKDCIKIE